MIHVLMSVSVVVALLYSVSLYSVISNTVAIQRVHGQTQSLNTLVKELDTSYLKLSSKITPDTLHAYGLEEGQVSFFISRNGSIGRIALRGNEL